MSSLYDEFRTEEEALENHRAKVNPPEFAAGQDDDWFAGLKSEGSQIDVDSFSSLSNPPSIGTGGSGGDNSNPKPKGPIEEEIIFGIGRGIFSVGKTLVSFFKDLFGVVKITSPIGWNNTYLMLSRYGFGLTGVGIFLYILSFFIPSIVSAMWVVILGILCIVVGLSGRVLMVNKAMAWRDEFNSEATTTDEIEKYPYMTDESDEVYEEEEYEEVVPEETDFEDLSLDSVEYEPEEEEMVSLYDVVEDEGYTVLDVEEPENVDDAIKELDMSAPGMQSRVYLYEQFSKILRSITPNFYEMTEIYEDTEVFSRYNFLLSNAASREGFNDADYTLLRIYENSFMYKLVIAANGKFKADKVGQSIENQERFNDMGKEVAPNVMVTTNVIGGNVHIDILKNEPPKLSVKDVWKSEEGFVTDPTNEMPVALGSDKMGEPVILDFSDIHSIALSGKPGMGKTWLAQSILAQLAFFNSPNQVQFIIADPKGKQGDFAKMDIPHVIRQVKTIDETMELLRWIKDVEIPRRESVLGAYDLSDIKDLRREHPEVELPYLYVVVEEMMSLGGNIKQQGSDLYNEYKLILSDLVNKCRYLGIRLFALSQRMTNDAIPKDLKVSLGLKMTAGADLSEVAQALDIKEKDFPYNISSKLGKYAIMTGKYNGGNPSFMIGSVLGDNNTENANTYRFINALWSKLEPCKESTEVREAVSKEIENASPTEMDDILNMVIDI